MYEPLDGDILRDCVFTPGGAQRKLADLGHADFCGCSCNMHLRWCNGPSVEAENSLLEKWCRKSRI